ncbi:bifunctional 4-hydroxy-2-oxoglutarate aldolase/2-dehydro-3-deoxy-phosphogluconate aldolase [Algicola sagamiensis]|uniref:bifunctional 4-hydroxy-2-oxoglutarate aldolase/2-dehydro-3-deoxy-phosphogluconate aldolase n=1 Tax=Algicola sagamiensis TaxID=163869 RepID=UPI00035D7406|nr:bifunctional 4-hydroxy-2-oxoglutarate aldolase/2-dehydro-3-deoxy-phosphogluconate aldolase [Algicola sagamiensis]
MTNTKLKISTLFEQGPIVPVLVVDRVEQAVPLAETLIESGINVLEITLRTPDALKVIESIATQVPDALVGAGTVAFADQLKDVANAGAKFAISPGLTRELLEAGKSSSVPLLPGVSSTSELMKGMEYDYRYFKFFPAEASGGVPALKSFNGPFPEIRFCPTGGINEKNYLDYLALPNVDCIGGSWIAPQDLIHEGNWEEIKRRTQLALSGVQTVI